MKNSDLTRQARAFQPRVNIEFEAARAFLSSGPKDSKVCEAVDSVTRMTLDPLQLKQLSPIIPTTKYSSAVAFELTAHDLLRKYSGFCSASIDPHAAALAKFQASEAQCAATNERFRLGSIDWCLIMDLQHVIADILGEFDVEEWLSSCGFGPGKVVGGRSEETSPYFKMTGRPTYSGKDAQMADSFLSEFPVWSRCAPRGVKRVAGSLLRFVPKNAYEHRSMLIEPNLNMFSQKGLGLMIRKRLKRWHIDLDEGQQTHKDLARLASKTAFMLSTLDLQAASDTIAYGLVASLIPEAWFKALTLFRCQNYSDGENGPTWLHKFSSMGNGYTFELESLIFFACAHVAAKRQRASTAFVSVYGDDIVIPLRAAAELVDILTECGFTVNRDKSHLHGLYHESCGGYFYDGQEITSLCIKNPIKSVQDAFLLANRFHDRANSATDGAVSAGLRRAHRTIIGRIPKPFRSFIYPDSLGVNEGGLAVPVTDIMLDKRDTALQTGYCECKQLVVKPRRIQMRNMNAACGELLYKAYSSDRDMNALMVAVSHDMRAEVVRKIHGTVSESVQSYSSAREEKDWHKTPIYFSDRGSTSLRASAKDEELVVRTVSFYEWHLALAV